MADYYTKLESDERFRREEVPILEVLTLKDEVRRLEQMIIDLQKKVNTND